MSNTRQNIPLNDCILNTLRAGVEVSCEPPGVHVRCLLVLLIHGDVRGSNVDSLPDRVPPPGGKQHLTNGSAVDGKTKDQGGILQLCASRPSWYVSVINDNHLVSLMNFNAAKVN
jgi:hypothetical protein